MISEDREDEIYRPVPMDELSGQCVGWVEEQIPIEYAVPIE